MSVVPVARVLTTAQLSDDLVVELRRLLLDAFAGDFSDDDWDHALGGRHVIVDDDGVAIAHAAVVARMLEVGSRPVRAGYVEAVGTATARQGEGHGRRAMTEIGAVLHEHFEMGALATGDHDFYAKLGWERWHGPTYVRGGATRTRSAEEDDGIMVLRYGGSADVDVTASISCDARSGDDW
ncbi:MAG: GNAT family N-acetyltransferase [Ilumatobacteraceae bacterium]